MYWWCKNSRQVKLAGSLAWIPASGTKLYSSSSDSHLPSTHSLLLRSTWVSFCYEYSWWSSKNLTLLNLKYVCFLCVEVKCAWGSSVCWGLMAVLRKISVFGWVVAWTSHLFYGIPFFLERGLIEKPWLFIQIWVFGRYFYKYELFKSVDLRRMPDNIHTFKQILEFRKIDWLLYELDSFPLFFQWSGWRY